MKMLFFFKENLTKIKLKWKIKSTIIDHFWSIDRGGFNRLKPLVKTGDGRLVPTLICSSDLHNSASEFLGT